MALSGDSLYVYSTEWSYLTNANTISYAIYNVKDTSYCHAQLYYRWDGERSIKIPYGVAVNPETHEIFVTDAKDYVTPGTLYCFSPDGKKKWQVTAGDIPAHFAFTYKTLK
jgi:DNA-binding beta-propeller fold protein YncE